MTTELTENTSPYKGLQPYTEADQPYFFGRERDREVIASNLFASPLTVLYGASGVGKSSVLLAGVVPQLKKTPRVAVVVFREWQDAGFEAALKREVLRAVEESAGKPADVSTQLPLDDFLFRCAKAFRGSIFFILDQFEEYFLYHPSSPETDEFDAAFARAVNRQEIGANFLLSMRDDGLSKLDRFQGRIPNLLNNMLRLEHLDLESASSAIRKPLAVYNDRRTDGQPAADIDKQLVAALLEDLQTGKVTLDLTGQGQVSKETRVGPSKAEIETPFLQLVLTRLWNEEAADTQRPDPQSLMLRLSTYERLGGAEKIVRSHLDKMMETEALEAHRETAASLFRFLVTPSGMKIAHTLGDLAAFTEQPAERVKAVLEMLMSPGVRILRPVAPPLGQTSASTRYEIFHDVLAPAILDWRTRYVTEAERVEAERKAEAQRARAEAEAATARRFRRLTFALAVVSLLALTTAAYALTQQRQAAENRKVAETERQRAERLKGEAETAKDAADLAIEAATLAQNAANAAKQAEIEERQKAEARTRAAEIAEAKALAAEREAEAARKETKAQEASARVAVLRLEAVQLIGQAKEAETRPNQAVEKYERAIDLFKQVGDVERQAETLRTAASVYLEIANTMEAELSDDDLEAKDEVTKFKNKAINYLEKARELYRQHERNSHVEEARTLELLAEFYVNQQDANKAAIYYEQAASLYRENDDELDNKISVLLSLGHLFRDTDRRKALGYYLKLPPLQQRIENVWATTDGFNVRTLLTIGVLYGHLGETQRARDYYRQATSTAKPEARALALIHLGHASSDLGDKREALQNFNEAVTIYQTKTRQGHRDNIAYALKASGDISYELDDKQEALKYYNQALNIYLRLRSTLPSPSGFHGIFYDYEAAQILDTLGRIYDDLGDRQKAVESRDQLSVVNKRLENLPESVLRHLADRVRLHTDRALAKEYEDFGNVKRAEEFYEKLKEKLKRENPEK